MTTRAITATEARRAMRWAQKSLRLQNWTLRLTLSDTVPECMAHDTSTDHPAAVSASTAYKTALVWLNSGHDEATTATGALASIMHEMVHVLMSEIGLPGKHQAAHESEFAWGVLANIMVMAYQRQKRPARKHRRTKTK